MSTEMQQLVWGRLLLAHGRVTDRLDRDLIEQAGMTFAEFEVLEHLAGSAQHTLRMNELADRVRLSPSGLTRRFDTLVRRGWVVREPCPDDRRGINARLTDTGFRHYRSAIEVHARGVEEALFAHLEDRELECLAVALGRVAEANATEDRRSLARD